MSRRTKPPAARLERWKLAWREAGGGLKALRAIGEYVAIRLWAALISLFPVEVNLRSARFMGTMWWWLHRNSRTRSMEHLRFGFPDLDDARREKIARESLKHWAQVYLVESILTPRLVNEWTWSRYVTLDDSVQPALRRLILGEPVIMVTPHFGNFELMGFLIAKLGFPLSAVMRPLDNALLTSYVERSREAGGLTLLYKKGAVESAAPLLESGGVLCFIADQDAGSRGIFVDFFNRPASWYKSIGLLAMHSRVPVIVGHMARARQGFHYRMHVDRVIRPEEWDAQDDPLRWITTAFANDFERAIRRHPEQYLWAHRRWKSEPGQRRTGKKRETPAQS
ncbi:MAG: hypothetical protein AMXMBFR47_40410 [Planctomycetota bacterium]